MCHNIYSNSNVFTPQALLQFSHLPNLQFCPGVLAVNFYTNFSVFKERGNFSSKCNFYQSTASFLRHKLKGRPKKNNK